MCGKYRRMVIGIVALMALNIMECGQFAAGHDSEEVVHRQLEAMKLAYSDGQQYIADPPKYESNDGANAVESLCCLPCGQYWSACSQTAVRESCQRRYDLSVYSGRRRQYGQFYSV